ncbi:putative Centrosomal protein of 104 kDa [Blattamonas nauphoetae]|uniref:Centrosomal protein of 104 kDa n=1 Tax=Blattamonas nauphoetae TaxID=2049346 RepID=A0ABQ9X5W3_9EUKA|nr:putative Centrosomal protein of 104 kDa [Blattamonas nauphoetae]
MSTLAYDIVAFSSELPERPASNLTKTNEDNHGWQSAPDPTFPQEIMLQFKNGPCHISALHILSHEYKIASKVDLYLGLPTNGSLAASAADCVFFILGHTSFQRLEAKQNQYSELKTINLNTYAQYVRLSFSPNFINAINPNNMIGIRSIRFEGTPVGSDPKHTANLRALLLQATNRPAPPSTLPLHISLPPSSNKTEQPHYIPTVGLKKSELSTEEMEREFSMKKDLAVREEDFDAAKMWKRAIERLREIAPQLTELEKQKDEAIAVEDYDQAKAVKLQITRIKEELKAMSAGKMDAFEEQQRKNRRSVENEPRNRGGFNRGARNDDYRERPNVSPPRGGKMGHSRSRSPSPPQAPLNSTYDDDRPLHSTRNQGAGSQVKLKGMTDEEKEAFGYLPKGSTNLRSKLGESMGAMDAGEADPETAFIHKKFDGPEGEHDKQSASANKSEEEAAREFERQQEANQKDIDVPRLTEKDREANSALISVVGEDIVALSLSNAWQHREEAAQKFFKPLTSPSASSSLPILLATLIKLAKDKNANVITAAFDTACSVVTSDTSGTAVHVAEKIAPLAVEKVGDGMKKVSDKAHEFISNCIATPSLGPSLVAEYLVPASLKTPPKAKVQIHQARLSLLKMCVEKEKEGGSRTPVAGIRLDMTKLCKYCCEQMSSANEKVREEAMSLFVLVEGENMKVSAQALQGAGLQPSIIKKIDDLRGNPQPAAQPAPSPFAQPKPTAKAAAPAPKQPAAAPKASSKAASVAPKANAPTPKQAPPPPADTGMGEEDDEGDMTTCDFCGEHNPSWTRDLLIQHQEQTCPCIIECPHCHSPVFIAELTHHRLNECEKSGLFVECGKCNEAVLQKELQKHMKSGECRILKNENNTHCPLCHAELENDDNVFIEHLTVKPGCPANPRTKGKWDAQKRGLQAPKAGSRIPGIAKR